MPSLAAITGGTGFVGRACAAAFAEAGWHVRLLARRDPTHPLLAGRSIEVVMGDLADATALTRLVRGASVVVHAAGAIRAGSPAAFLATNRDGTARLAAAVAREAPGCRFILVSSQAARCPTLSPYAASKLAGEQAAAAALGPARPVILRPGIIHGPWDQATAALLRLAGGRIVPVPAAPEPCLTMIDIRDVARAALAFGTGGPAGTYELGDGATDGHAWRDIVRIACAPGVAPRLVEVPDAVMLAAGAASDAWAAVTQRPALFGRGKAREILHRDWRPDPTLRPPPDVWTPRIALRDGLRETRDWWLAHPGGASAPRNTKQAVVF